MLAFAASLPGCHITRRLHIIAEAETNDRVLVRCRLALALELALLRAFNRDIESMRHARTSFTLLFLCTVLDEED
jgi:hypothetical protein